jgi:hypothetical protein
MICALRLIELDYPSATVQPNVLSEFRPGIKEVQGRGSLLDAVPLGSLKQSLKGEGKLIQGNPQASSRQQQGLALPSRSSTQMPAQGSGLPCWPSQQ